MFLDAHSDKVAAGSISDDIDGFLAIVDAKNQFPQTTRKTVFLRPGHINNVALKITKVQSDASAKTAAEPEQRLCYFPDEMSYLQEQNKELEIFSEYSQGNCFLECHLNHAREMMKNDANVRSGCVPWYFPTSKNVNVSICDPFDSFKFVGYMKNVSQSKCGHCLPDCTATVYDSAVSAAPFRKCNFKNLGVSPLCHLDSTIEPQIWSESLLAEYESLSDKSGEAIPAYVTQKVGERTSSRTNLRYYVHNNGDQDSEIVFKVQNENEKSYDAYDKDIAMVTFFFDSPTAFVYERKARMTLVDFVSQIGGLFGLCMGFSFISIIEMGYWLTIRMFKNTFQSH